MRHLGMIFKHYGYPGNPIGGHLSNLPLFFLLLCSSSGNRNCLLCDNNVVKITDVAMGISLFNSDYSEVRGRSCAPIRWQPWETLLLVSNVVMQSGMHPWSIIMPCTYSIILDFIFILGVTGVTLPSVKEGVAESREGRQSWSQEIPLGNNVVSLIPFPFSWLRARKTPEEDFFFHY